MDGPFRVSLSHIYSSFPNCEGGRIRVRVRVRVKIFKNWGKHYSGKKKSGKNTSRVKKNRGKIKSGKKLVTCEKFSHFSPGFFPPIRYST